MKDNISPEEKLLRLIRSQKKSPAIVNIESKSPTVISDIKTPAKRFNFFLVKKYLSFLNVHKIVPAAFVLSCIYLIVCLLYPLVSLRKITLPKIEPKETVSVDARPQQEVKSYELYLEGLKDRKIFAGAVGQEKPGPVSSINTDLMKDINLVGIISAENPQAIIEDKKNQKTYYVTKGQFIGEFQVEDIQEGKVILNYKGQSFELYL